MREKRTTGLVTGLISFVPAAAYAAYYYLVMTGRLYLTILLILLPLAVFVMSIIGISTSIRTIRKRINILGLVLSVLSLLVGIAGMLFSVLFLTSVNF